MSYRIHKERKLLFQASPWTNFCAHLFFHTPYSYAVDMYDMPYRIQKHRIQKNGKIKQKWHEIVSYKGNSSNGCFLFIPIFVRISFSTPPNRMQWTRIICHTEYIKNEKIKQKWHEIVSYKGNSSNGCFLFRTFFVRISLSTPPIRMQWTRIICHTEYIKNGKIKQKWHEIVSYKGNSSNGCFLFRTFFVCISFSTPPIRMQWKCVLCHTECKKTEK